MKLKQKLIQRLNQDKNYKPVSDIDDRELRTLIEILEEILDER